MSHKRYRRDPYSKALVLAQPEEVKEFLEKQEMERTLSSLKEEIYNMKTQLQDMFSGKKKKKAGNNRCQ